MYLAGIEKSENPQLPLFSLETSTLVCMTTIDTSSLVLSTKDSLHLKQTSSVLESATN